MRLRSGVALAILLCASLSAFYVSLIGQRHVIGSSVNTRMIDRIMVTLADFSLAFDEIKRNPRSQAAVRAAVVTAAAATQPGQRVQACQSALSKT